MLRLRVCERVRRAAAWAERLSGDLVTFTSQRKAMLKVLNALVVSDDRAQLLRSAEQLNEAQYKEEFEERLDVLETLIRDAWMLSLGVEPTQLVNEDLTAELTGNQSKSSIRDAPVIGSFRSKICASN